MGRSDPHVRPLAHWPLAGDCSEVMGKTLHGSNKGAVFCADETGGAASFHGSLADVRIHDRALSAGEVQSLGVG